MSSNKIYQLAITAIVLTLISCGPDTSTINNPSPPIVWDTTIAQTDSAGRVIADDPADWQPRTFSNHTFSPPFPNPTSHGRNMRLKMHLPWGSTALQVVADDSIFLFGSGVVLNNSGEGIAILDVQHLSPGLHHAKVFLGPAFNQLFFVSKGEIKVQ